MDTQADTGPHSHKRRWVLKTGHALRKRNKTQVTGRKVKRGKKEEEEEKGGEGKRMDVMDRRERVVTGRATATESESHPQLAFCYGILVAS